MPGNEFGDRLHNFFAQENFSQGQNQPQVLDGNWPAPNDHVSIGNHRSLSVLGSNPKSYNLQQPDSGRGPGSHLFSGPNGMNFGQPSQRHDISKSQLQVQQQNFNDSMYRHFYQAQQDEGRFLGANSGSSQPNVPSLGGTTLYESQSLGREHQTHAPVRSEPSESHGSFDLFGSQHQLSRHQQTNMLQPQPGFNDMQQHMMLMRMQEFQRHQQDAMQQSNVNPIPLFSKASPSANSSSSLVNGAINSAQHSYPWGATETGNVNWLHRSSPAFQGSSSNGLVSTNHGQGQGQNSMGLIPERPDQSLYGVPVSTSRTGVTQYTQMMADRTYIHQTASYNNSFPGDHYFGTPDRVPTPKQKCQGENFFGSAHGESLNNIMNMETPQQENIKQNINAQEFELRQEPISMERTAIQAASQNNDVALDPTEERILFGSDDNIWAAFGKSTNLSEEACNSVGGAGPFNELPSYRGGTWSALMQSAVAETSTTDVQPHEGWRCLNSKSSEPPSGNHSSSTCNSVGKQPNPFAEGRVPLSPSLNSDPVRPSECTNVNKNNYGNLHGFEQPSHNKLPTGLGHGVQANSSQRPSRLSEEGRKWLDGDSIQREEIIHGGALQPGRLASAAHAHAKLENFGSMRSTGESSQFPSTSSQVNYWKNANDIKSKGSEFKAHEVDYRDKQENSNDSYHTSGDSLRENALSDVSDSRPAGKEKPTRKFQYHPMANLNEDVDPHGVTKHIHKQAMTQQNSRLGQSMFSAQVQKSSIEVGKRQSSSSSQRDGNGSAEAHPHSFFLNSGSNIPVHLNRSADIHSPIVETPSSPNMLQLLQKVDQSREVGATMCQKGSSEMQEVEMSGKSIPHLQRSHSSISQGYGLQLGPPSQYVPTKSHLVSSQSCMQSINSSSAIEIGKKAQAQAPPPLEVQSLPYSRSTVQEELTNTRCGDPGSGAEEFTPNKIHGKSSSSLLNSGYMYTRSVLENQQLAPGQTLANQSNNNYIKHPPDFTEKDGCHVELSRGQSVETFSRDMIGNSQCANLATSSEGVSTPQTAIFGISNQRPCLGAQNNMPVNSQAQQHPSGIQSHKELLHLPGSHQLNIVESLSSAQGSQGEDEDVKKGQNFLSDIGSKKSANLLNDVQREIKETKPLDVSTVMNSTASVQKDIEAFGQSLKPNHFLHHNYSLLNQMRATRNIETEQSSMKLKRMRMSDGPQFSHASPQSADSSDNNLERNRTDRKGTVPTQQDLPVEQEHTQFPYQPLLNNQYGTGKSGQKSASVPVAEPPFSTVKSYNGLHAINHMDRIQQNNVVESLRPTPAPVENIPSSQSFLMNMMSAQQHSAPRPKKRRRVKADLIPWYKEVSGDLQSLKSIRDSALGGWEEEINRVTEKVVEEIHPVNTLPGQKARRRLLLTTHLMQQLFHPPPSSILLADSKLEFQNVAYMVSRMTLGSACGLVSSFIGHNTSMAKADGGDREPSSHDCETPEGNSNLLLSNFLKECAVRKRKLEDQLSKVENSESLLNMTVDSQDLDKFSIINRFAKFHTRATPNASCSPAEAAALIHKALPQKYVTAAPVTNDLPTGVKCLSL
ncbi:unnamed protein product [Cuscuta epithymum]|uniref:Uncharacterized protein n=1 Tax=Cuscuta epithymum TaxID=186058 RepID=A0AAV0FXK0_9ASTE|nr:unnamed protein product [Cuscuta epithymum]